MMIESIKLFREMFTTETYGRFAEAMPAEPHLHVTHDLVIVRAKLAFLRMRVTESNCTHSQGDFAAVVDGICVRVLEKKKARTRLDLASFFTHD